MRVFIRSVVNPQCKPFVKLYFFLFKKSCRIDMDDVTGVNFDLLPPEIQSAFVRPFRINYMQNGRDKYCDMVEVFDSVAVLIFNVTRFKLILLRQFRPAVYFNTVKPEDRKPDQFVDTDKYPPSKGITLEVCAGIADNDIAIKDLACQEVFRQCSYRIFNKHLTNIVSYRAGVGVQGSEQVLFYCEVTDSMKAETGLMNNNDDILEVVEMSVPELEEFLGKTPEETVTVPPSCLFALMWFLHIGVKKHRKEIEKAMERTDTECKDSKTNSVVLEEDDLL